jgi:cobalt-zinc-cadmium efflux system membrane fusion protein
MNERRLEHPTPTPLPVPAPDGSPDGSPDGGPEGGPDGGPAAAPRRPWRRRAAVAVLAISALAALGSVGARTDDDDDGPATRPETPTMRDGALEVPRTLLTHAGVQVGRVEEREVTPRLALTGRVEVDPRARALVGARIEGRVRRVLRIEGATVRVGEPLAELESATLGVAQAEVVKARAREQAALAHAARERRLVAANVSSARDAEVAEADAAEATGARVAAERTLSALGGDEAGEPGVLVVRAPLAGKVLRAFAQRGQVVEPRDTLFEVADTTRLWVELHVFEGELGRVQLGDVVEVRAAGVAARGRVEHIGERIDPEDRTAVVRVVVDAAAELRPGMAVTARLATSAAAARAPAVPLDAIVRVDNDIYVFVAVGPTRFALRKVVLGDSDEQYVIVTKGLGTSESVVTSGALALKSELFR